MGTDVSPSAGQISDPSARVPVDALIAAYYDRTPDVGDPSQRVAFGTSGHRGSSFTSSFNEAHILAITQAVCEYRAANAIDGPLFIGMDTHALSLPALQTALEVLSANAVEVRVAANGEFTPTPAISHAILVHNRGRTSALADGIVVTPSHNPPEDGGFKYNPPNGGPADTSVTGWIQDRANALLPDASRIRRLPLRQALTQSTTREHDFLGAYTADLANIIDFPVIRAAGVRIGVDPLGGAGVHYWSRIASEHGIDITVISSEVDPQFGFMPLDWDGRIRMDPSSRFAMQRLIARKDDFDVVCACDTDHDRHGIVAPGAGLIPSNHYLSVAIDYLFRNRPAWSADTAVGKEVDVVIIRKGVEETRKVTLGRLEDTDKAVPASAKTKEEPAEKPVTQKALGLDLAALSKDLRTKYKIKDSVKGVIVTGVDGNSDAAEKRLSAGDVIVEVAQEAVTNAADIKKRVDQLKKDGKKSVLLLVSNGEGELRFVALSVQ